MDQKFILRIEQPERVSFQVVKGRRRALELAHTYLANDGHQRVAVLDASGRVVWEAIAPTIG